MKADIINMGIKRLAIFLVCLASIPLWPWVACTLGQIVSMDFLFFAPQIAFPYHSVFTSDPNIAGSHVQTFSSAIANLLTVGQWALFAVLFTMATIRVKKTVHLILLALLTIVLAIFAIDGLIRASGHTLFLDGL